MTFEEDPQPVTIKEVHEDHVLYHEVPNVEQDESAMFLSESPKGMVSIGFSPCYAIIIKKTSEHSKDVALMHVSSLAERDIDFFNEMIEQLKGSGEVTIEIARSKQAYTEQYDFERSYDKDAMEPNAFFKKHDALYLQFFSEHFSTCIVCPVVQEMPHGLIVVNSEGEVDYLAEYPIGSIDLELDSAEEESLSQSSSLSP